MRATIYKTAIKKQENGFKMMELVKEASRNYKDTPTALNNPDSLIDTGGYEEITDMIVTQIIEQFDDFILTEVFDEVYTYRYARKTKLSALDFVMNLVNDKCFLNDIIKRMEASIA